MKYGLNEFSENFVLMIGQNSPLRNTNIATKQKVLWYIALQCLGYVYWKDIFMACLGSKVE